MTLKSSNKVETNRYELEIEIDSKTFMDEVERVYRKQVKGITIPGFRKGKAPRRLIEKEYGEGIFYEDAIKNLYPAAIVEAAEEAGIELVRDKVDLDVQKADKDGLTFKTVVTVEPEVSIEGYKGIEVTPVNVEVNEEDIEEELKKVQQRNSRLVNVEDGEAKDGDTTIIDFKGLLDGVPFEGGTAERQTLVLGSGTFIPGFEDKIVGHKAGEEFTIDVTFPEEYQVEELKGKPVQFEIKLHEVKTRELPEVNDDFVKDVSEFDTVDEYKADLKEKLIETRKKEADRDRDNQIAEKLEELVQAEIPEAMYDEQIDNFINEFAVNIRSQGIDIDTYFKYTGLTEERLRETYYDRAVSHVKVRLALRKIAELENVEVTDEDVEAKYQEIADSYSVSIDKVKAAFSAKDIKKDINVERAMEIVKSAVVEVEKPAETENSSEETSDENKDAE